MKHLQKYMKYKSVKLIVYIAYFLYFLYKRYMKTIIKSAIFLTILLFLIVGIGNILAVPTTINEKTGIQDIHKYPNSYDVCIIGRSTVVCNISCQQLYEKYGIAAVSAGVSQQSFPMTLYTLEEIFEYQSPKVIFLDTRSFFNPYRVEYEFYQNEPYLHFTLDDIKTPSIKNKALKQIKKYNEEIDLWDYKSKLYYSHGNWKKLSEKNFLKYDSKAADAMHGNVAYLNIADNVSNIYASSDQNSASIITKKTEQYISDSIELCKNNGSELILLTSYVHTSKANHNALVRLSNKYRIKHIDINDYLLKTGFDYAMDLNDDVHFNLSGAVKMTNLLGEYLHKNYNFTDKRKNTSYQRYENQKEFFRQQKKFLNEKQSLLSAVTFYEYLTALTKLDQQENIIFLSVYGDAFNKLTKKEAELLQSLGTKTNLLGKNGSSYAVVISNNKIREGFAFINSVSLEDEIGTLSYEIKSGGSKSGERSSIMINDRSVTQIGKGFNFVIYNTRFEQISNSCFFNTTEEVNPTQSKYKTSSLTGIQQETEPNIWKKIE